MLFGLRTSFEGAEISPSTGLRVLLAGIEAVFAGFELSDHERLDDGRREGS